jgi:hypothetical protein
LNKKIIPFLQTSFCYNLTCHNVLKLDRKLFYSERGNPINQGMLQKGMFVILCYFKISKPFKFVFRWRYNYSKIKVNLSDYKHVILTGHENNKHNWYTQLIQTIIWHEVIRAFLHVAFFACCSRPSLKYICT